MASLKTYYCCDCGKQYQVGYRPGMRRWCFECGLTRGIQAALEMANKSGPAYDRWLQSQGPRGRPRHGATEG